MIHLLAYKAMSTEEARSMKYEVCQSASRFVTIHPHQAGSESLFSVFCSLFSAQLLKGVS